MEIDQQSALDLASAIRGLDGTIFRLGWVFIIGFAIFAALMWYALRVYEGKTNDRADEFFPHKADKLFDSGDIEGLFSYCEKYYKAYPNDVTINWYFAIGYYHVNQWSKAESYFKKVVQLNPSWKDNVTPYLSEIDNTKSDDLSH